MAKLKKNYSINSAAVELVDTIAEKLNMRPGELIEVLATRYGVQCYTDIVRQRAEDLDTIVELSQLADCAAYECYEQQDFETMRKEVAGSCAE